MLTQKSINAVPKTTDAFIAVTCSCYMFIACCYINAASMTIEVVLVVVLLGFQHANTEKY